MFAFPPQRTRGTSSVLDLRILHTSNKLPLFQITETFQRNIVHWEGGGGFGDTSQESIKNRSQVLCPRSESQRKKKKKIKISKSSTITKQSHEL